jgi:hypothetical protein
MGEKNLIADLEGVINTSRSQRVSVNHSDKLDDYDSNPNFYFQNTNYQQNRM